MPTKKPWKVGDTVRLAHSRGYLGTITSAEQPGGLGTRWLFGVDWTKFPKNATARTAVSLYAGRTGKFKSSDLLPPGRTEWEKKRDAERYPAPKKTKSPNGWTEVDEDGNVVTYPAGTPYPKTTGVDPFKREADQ